MWLKRKMVSLWLCGLLGGLAYMVVPTWSGKGVAQAQSRDGASARELRVSVDSAGRWVEVGRLAFDRFYATRTLELKGRGDGTVVRVRLDKRGGGAAHLDTALVAGRAPLAVIGAPQYKLSRADYDVADVSDGPTVLLYQLLPGERALLTLRARIEPTVIGKTAFRFPRVNTGRAMGRASSFYTYRLGSRGGRLQVDGELQGESLGTRLFAESIYVDSGHPQGATYGWVQDDGRNLYIAMDFTSDNTMDGELDYGRVFALVDGKVKVFTVRQSKTRWGRVGFTYTDRVGYQHKVYEFAIPLRALGGARAGQLVQLAFAAYGTSAAGAWDTQPLAYEPGSETYLFRHWTWGAGPVHAQLFDVLGDPVGSAIQLQTGSTNADQGGVAVDPDLGRFLVTWDEQGVVLGRFVDPLTEQPDGAEFAVSDNSQGDTFNSRAIYDPDLQRYFVIWLDDRTGTDALYGRFFASDGTPVAASFHLDDMDKYDGQANTPNIVYNTADQEFLVVFVRAGAVEAQVLDPADGSEVGARISIAADGYAPSVAYEPSANTYLVAWRTTDVGVASYMRCRLVWPDGNTEDVQEPMPSTPAVVSTAVVGEGSSGRFLVVGHDDTAQLSARFVNSDDGVLLDTAEFTLHNPSVECGWAGVASNPDLGHFGAGCMNAQGWEPWMTVFPTLHVDPLSVATDETGTTATFDVSLLTMPSDAVDLTVVSSNTDEATVSPAVLQFTRSTWDTPQTVTVTGVDDTDVDGDIAYTIDLTVDNTTSAPQYRFTVVNVAGINADDDVDPGPECGDGLREGTEACDDGNTVDGDGCSSTCDIEAPPCGDGVVDTGEECDDGNDTPGDGCYGCTVDRGWTCQDEPSYCEEDEKSGCGCRAGSTDALPPMGLILLIGVLLLIRRRRF